MISDMIGYMMVVDNISHLSQDISEYLARTMNDGNGNSLFEIMRFVEQFIAELEGISPETCTHLKLLALAAAWLELTPKLDEMMERERQSPTERQRTRTDVMQAYLMKMSRQYGLYAKEAVIANQRLYPTIGFECETIPRNFSGKIDDYFGPFLTEEGKALKQGLVPALATSTSVFPFEAKPDYGSNTFELITDPTSNPSALMRIFQMLADIGAVEENGWGGFHENIAGPQITIWDTSVLKLRSMWTAQGYDPIFDEDEAKSYLNGKRYPSEIWKKPSVVNNAIVYIPSHKARIASSTIGNIREQVVEQRSFERINGSADLLTWARKVHFDFYCSTCIEAKQGNSKLHPDVVRQLTDAWDSLSNSYDELNARYELPPFPENFQSMVPLLRPESLAQFVADHQGDLDDHQILIEITQAKWNDGSFKYNLNSRQFAAKMLEINHSGVNTFSEPVEDKLLMLTDIPEDGDEREQFLASIPVSIALLHPRFPFLNQHYGAIHAKATLDENYRKEWRKIVLAFRVKVKHALELQRTK